jgi:hypothetical protein
MAVKELAETVILQSIEDLWDKNRRKHVALSFAVRAFLSGRMQLGSRFLTGERFYH